MAVCELKMKVRFPWWTRAVIAMHQIRLFFGVVPQIDSIASTIVRHTRLTVVN